MIGGSSLFGIDISKGISKEEVVDDKVVKHNVLDEQYDEVEEFEDEDSLESSSSVNVEHILPEKSNNVRHELMQETENLVDSSYKTGQERNL